MSKTEQIDIWNGLYADCPASVRMIGDRVRAFIGERMAYGEDEVGILRLALRPAPILDPRPDDLGELAALVAKELRKRGIWARADSVADAPTVCISRPAEFMAFRWHGMLSSDFDNLGPRECANVIQSLEATRAQEWAGDK